MPRYPDCYKGCGGEDCACCEIHHDHLADQRYPVDSDDYPEHRPNYEPDDDDCMEDCDGCPFEECECRREPEIKLPPEPIRSVGEILRDT